MSNTPALTRLGALEVTQVVDRIANLIELEAKTLGIDPKLAAALVGSKNADGSVLEVGVLDRVADAVEAQAKANFPLVAGELPPALQKINDEKAKENKEAKKRASEFDPSVIGEQVPGPLEVPPGQPHLDGHFTQIELCEMSEEFGAKLSAANKTAASKLEYVTVQGYDGFTAQIRQLEALSTEAASLEAQIDAAIGPLLAAKAGLDKDIAKVHQTIKDEYKANLSAVGNVTIERKTALVTARAQLQVVAAKRSLNDVQAELLDAVTKKYGAEVAAYIKATSGALQDANKQMKVAFKGFELEQKAGQTHTASTKTAGLADLLATFQDWLEKGWRKMVQVAKSVGAIVSRQGASCAAAHDTFMADLAGISSGKAASAHGFDLFKV